jgi:hypothetical protein
VGEVKKELLTSFDMHMAITTAPCAIRLALASDFHCE